MTEQILITLENLKYPKVKIINKPLKQQGLLFEPESSVDIQFNGYSSLNEYQAHLDNLFQKFKSVLNERMAQALNQPQQMKQVLDLVELEIKLFRKRYFPKSNIELPFTRIELLKNSISIDSYQESVKKNKSFLLN